jgi:cyclopropane-fatty-acyl-phospholipid synthase
MSGGLSEHRGMNSVANRLTPVIDAFLGGEPPIAFRFWDGSSLGAAEADTAIVLKSPRALTRLVYAPGELGFARAYVSDDLDIEGDIFEVLALRDMLEARTIDTDLRLNSRAVGRLLKAVVALSALSLPPPVPPEEVRLRGRAHSRNRDADAISHHYDVGNDFYRLILGDTMTYSCAYFEQDHLSLDEAQAAKYDLVCRKLGLEPGMRLLDVGCGWGGMVLHAARNYGVSAVGITLSHEQADFAAQRASESEVAHMVDIRYQDYRDVGDGPFDAISSIGMFEHVGLAQLAEYFAVLERLLEPLGRLLNHAISKRSGQPEFGSRSFVSRYVFPDGELQEVGGVVSAMQKHGLEARDVESLREHYARTLRWWVQNLETNWDEAVDLVGLGRAKVWRLYMAGSALSFEASRINVHQVLGVKPDGEGVSGMPSTPSAWVASHNRPRV